MTATHVRRFSVMVALVAFSLLSTACNTTKATIDTTVKFFSSTSPNEMFTEDGLVVESQR